MHFARWEEGVRTELPIFGGQRGPAINRMLTEIETNFTRHLDELRKVQSIILNVKATTWHEEYNRFRSAIKELEVMMTNVITYAFDAVKTVEQGVEVLDVFTHLNSREVRRLGIVVGTGVTLARLFSRPFVARWTRRRLTCTPYSSSCCRRSSRSFPPRRSFNVSIDSIRTTQAAPSGLEISSVVSSA